MIRFTLRSLLVLGIAGGLGACAFGDFEGVNAKSRTLSTETPQGVSSNRYIAFRAGKRKVGGFGSIGVPRDLHAPFRMEVTAGVFEEDRRPGGGFLYAEVADLADGFRLGARAEDDGLVAFAHHTSGGATAVLGEIPFPVAALLDLAIEHDGAEILYLAREHGSGPYELVALAPDDGGTPRAPRLGVEGLSHGGEFGFDDYRLVTGAPPVDPTPREAVAILAFEAGDLQVEALHGLDGLSPDIEGARRLVSASIGRLDEAILALEGLGSAAPSGVAKRLGKARSRALRAERKLEGCGIPRRALRAIEAALVQEGLAALLLRSGEEG